LEKSQTTDICFETRVIHLLALAKNPPIFNFKLGRLLWHIVNKILMEVQIGSNLSLVGYYGMVTKRSGMKTTTIVRSA
jgi:hypothetical protein